MNRNNEVIAELKEIKNELVKINNKLIEGITYI